MTFSKRFSAVLIGLLLATLIGCTGSGEMKRETTGEYIDDATVTTRVKTAIYKEPTLKVSQINVETYKGQVQLSGFVDSSDAKSRAAAVARDVKGVKGVSN